MTTKKTHKLDIFDTLNHISRKDVGFYDNLSEEEEKAFQPLVVARWLSGIKSERQIYFLNELVNPFTFQFTKHKKLLYYLMTVCTSGKATRYFWNKTSSKKTSSVPLTVKVIRDYYGYNTLQAIEVLPLLSSEVILDYAEQLGRQPDEITKIKRELKKTNEKAV